jgi:hypothetical protein
MHVSCPTDCILVNGASVVDKVVKQCHKGGPRIFLYFVLDAPSSPDVVQLFKTQCFRVSIFFFPADLQTQRNADMVGHI